MASIGKTRLDSGWLAARFTEVSLSGTQLTTTHPPSGTTSPWLNAVVPGTVLETLVENKVVPDPFYGLQNETIIDIADSRREYYTFWFFTAFQIRKSAPRSEFLWNQLFCRNIFKVPLGVTPRVTLHGWNYHGGHTIH